jgi:hypothetical protein
MTKSHLEQQQALDGVAHVPSANGNGPGLNPIFCRRGCVSGGELKARLLTLFDKNDFGRGC